MTFRSLSVLACFISLSLADTTVAGIFRDPGLPARESSRSNCEQEVRFTSVRFYSGRRGNGAEFSAGDYDSSNGGGVVATTETYPSASRARAEMMRRVKGATRIIDRVRSGRRENRLYTERAVLIESGRSRDQSYGVILRLKRDELSIIESSSLRVALEFERQFYSK